MMDCSEIRTLLSEYLDDALDAKVKAMVQEHLGTCPACREELDSLKTLVEGIGSLESVKAPADFLDQLHRRMERRSRISEIKEWLFRPLRVKIPLQLAGAAVLAFLIFSVLSVQQAPLRLYPKSEPEKKAEEKAYYVDESKKLKPAARSEAPAQNAATHEPAKETREVALKMKKQVQAKATPEPSAASAPSSAPASPAAAEVQRQKLAARAPLQEDKKEDQLKKEPESVLSITKAIEASQGRLLSIDYNRRTGRPESIYAEIPASELSLLYGKLRELGDLQVSPETRIAKDSGLVHVRIRLIVSP
jgi:Putative zinc-finger